MSKLKVIYTVLLSDDGNTGPCIEFHKWLPEENKFHLVKSFDDLTVTLSINRDCIAQLGDITEETIKNSVVNRIYKFFAKVDFDCINSELATFIYDERESYSGKHFGIKTDDAKYLHLSQEYNRLGELSLKRVLQTCNRFISFARNIKGQYWLNVITPNKDNFANLNNAWQAQAIIDNKHFRWFPPDTNRIRFSSIFHIASSIKIEEWSEVKSFINSDSRPNIVFELLANSRYLIEQEHRRSSVIESVTALEIAVNNFTQFPKIDILRIAQHGLRIDTGNIGNQSKHMGFSCSLRYLVPLLLSPDELDDKILKMCFKGIEIRNNVVHEGQRDVAEDLAKEVIIAISRCCTILNSYTKKRT